MCFTVQLSRFLSFFLSATAFILYQSCFCLSRTFLTFFKVFYFDLLSFSATAIIEYHIFISLSIVFYFYFFKLLKTILTTNQQFVLYNIIIIHHLSTAFFTFFQFFSTILDSMNFQAFTTIKTAVNVRRTDSTFHYLCVLFHQLYTSKILSSNYNRFIRFQTQFLFHFLFFIIAD